MDIAPVKSATINGLVGIGSNEEAARCFAEIEQQAQQRGVEVLRFIYDDCIITLIFRISDDKRLRAYTRLLPGLYCRFLELLHVCLIDIPDGFFLEFIQAHLATRTARSKVIFECSNLASDEDFVYLFLHVGMPEAFYCLCLRLLLQQIPFKRCTPRRQGEQFLE